MDRQAMTELVISELGKGRTPDDVARMVCEKGMLQWSDAELLVREVRRTHANQIAQRQTPMMLGLVVMGLFVGAVMAGYLAIVLGTMLINMATAPAYGAAQAVSFAMNPYRLIIVLGMLTTGSGMVAGSILGSGDMLKTALQGHRPSPNTQSVTRRSR